MWHPANLPLAFINYERDYEIYITVAEIRWGLPYVSAVSCAVLLIKPQKVSTLDYSKYSHSINCIGAVLF